MDETEEGGHFLRDTLGVAIRRRNWLVLPAIIGTLAAAVAALLMDPVYESSATILIESQQIPTTLVASPVTSYADERIAKIRQQILSRDNLVQLITRNKLYPEERSTQQLSDVVTLMRDAIKVDLVSADAGPGRARTGNATIAFKLSFSYSDRDTTQDVTEQLTGMFIDADMRRRTEQASGTAAFLSRRADELRIRLVKLEGEINEIRKRFNGALPDQILGSSQSSAALRGEIARIDVEIQSTLQGNAALATRMDEPAEDVTQTELARAEASLDRLTATYSDSHPDVIAAREVVSRLRETAVAPSRRGNRSVLAAELQAGRSRLALLSRRRSELQSEAARSDQLISLSPQAAYELNTLQRDYDSLNEQYQRIRDRQLEAQVAANLEAEEKGERFTLVEAPALPEKPIKPNRVLVVLFGLLAGVAVGFAAVAAREVIAKPIHGTTSLTRLTGAPPLATIPLTRPGPRRIGKMSVRDLIDWLKWQRAIS